MVERKAYSTKLNEFEKQALDYAGELWQEHADNTSELIRQILADWLRIKKDTLEGGTRTQTLQALIEIKAMLRELMENKNND
jgi:hypothetical protein